MVLDILQVGHAVLRQRARPLALDEICRPEVQELIGHMRETMHAAPGVGLAAPQIGIGLQLAVIEEREEYLKEIPPEKLVEMERHPLPFQVIVNPTITLGEETTEFFEGCLSLARFGATVARARRVVVDCWNERAEPVRIEASGWYARILQHEIDHLHGNLYIDRMNPRSFMTLENHQKFWKDVPIGDLRAALGV
jgi:peptide deformylase